MTDSQKLHHFRGQLNGAFIACRAAGVVPNVIATTMQRASLQDPRIRVLAVEGSDSLTVRLGDDDFFTITFKPAALGADVELSGIRQSSRE